MEPTQRLIVLGDIFEDAARALWGAEWRMEVALLVAGKGPSPDDILSWPKKGAPGWVFELMRPVLIERRDRIDKILKAVPVIQVQTPH